MTTAAWREARGEDLEAIHALRRAFCAESHQHWDEATDRAVLAEMLASPTRAGVWVLEGEGTAVGYAAVGFGFSLEFRGRDAFVDELYVAPVWRGRGYGSAALRLIEEALRAQGVRAVHLEVDDTNHGAADLYGRSGFTDHGRRLMTRWIGPRSG